VLVNIGRRHDGWATRTLKSRRVFLSFIYFLGSS
jgi:hypothetical protein